PLTNLIRIPRPGGLPYLAFVFHTSNLLLQPRSKVSYISGAVQIVERWVLARLRHYRFYSLAELNKAIAGLVADLNQRPFKRLE
ncbi:IS21 family transposase, partial [Paraburkholderia bannensis]